MDGLSVGDKDTVFWDRELSGFGVRVYPSGAKVYVVQTRALGKSKRVTLGRARSDLGRSGPPQGGHDHCTHQGGRRPLAHSIRFGGRAYRRRSGGALSQGACRGSLQAPDEGGLSLLVVKFVMPVLGKLAINEVEREHIAALHYQHRETPYQANRILEVVRKMFNLAEAWGLRKDGANPCRFVQKYKERKRERFLTDEEFRRLGQVLNEIEAEGSETLSAVTAVRALVADRVPAERDPDAALEGCRSTGG